MNQQVQARTLDTLENMDVSEEVYMEARYPDDLAISGRWVETEKSPGVSSSSKVCLALH